MKAQESRITIAVLKARPSEMKVALKAIGTTISRAAAAVSSIGGVCHPCVVHVAQTSRKPVPTTLVRVHVLPPGVVLGASAGPSSWPVCCLGTPASFRSDGAARKDAQTRRDASLTGPRSSSVNKPQSAG